jgi:hypothetical protein
VRLLRHGLRAEQFRPLAPDGLLTDLPWERLNPKTLHFCFAGQGELVSLPSARVCRTAGRPCTVLSTDAFMLRERPLSAWTLGGARPARAADSGRRRVI